MPPSSPHLSTAELARRLHVDESPSAIASIDQEALGRMVEHLRRRPEFLAYERHRWDDPRFWLPEGSPAERSQYFAIGNSINFRFWTLTNGVVTPASGDIDGQTLSGAMYMWRCLRRCVDRGEIPVLNADFLAGLLEADFDQIFADDAGARPLDVGKADRLANLRDLGRQLTSHWAGEFYNVLEAVQGSMVEFVRLSGTFRAFDDPLFKLTMVNAILHLGSGLVEFDADPLPGIDYHLLKQIVRQGVVVPNEVVSERLRLRVPLSDQEAFEMRRVALLAFLELSRRLRVSGENLDNLWWWNRSKCLEAAPVCLDRNLSRECPFLDACAQHTLLGTPMALTRHY